MRVSIAHSNISMKNVNSTDRQRRSTTFYISSQVFYSLFIVILFENSLEKVATSLLLLIRALKESDPI